VGPQRWSGCCDKVQKCLLLQQTEIQFSIPPINLHFYIANGMKLTEVQRLSHTDKWKMGMMIQLSYMFILNK